MAPGRLIKRVLRNETPAQGKARLLRARERSLHRIDSEAIFSSLSKKLKSVSKKLLKNGEIFAADPYWFFSEKATGAARVGLSYNGFPIAFSKISFGIRNGKKELFIENIQGMISSYKIFSDFKHENSRSWNVALVQSLVDAAYECGFDRVLLRDITTSLDYLSPFISRKGKTVQEVRERMKQLYTWTRKDCDFTKEEQIGHAKYWVREFP